MTVVFVHGIPETREIWSPLQVALRRNAVAIALPGFGTPRPEAFTGTKDAYAQSLAEELAGIGEPADVVGHDIGALLTLRVASAFGIPLRSWAVDVANIFHPGFEWPERVHKLQTPGLGEEMLKTAREADPQDPGSTTSRLVEGGVPPELARRIAAAHDDVMDRSILDFYRSAVPNVAAGWWDDIQAPARSPGLVLLLPDPPEDEAMSLEVAGWLGAETARLDDLHHCWMAEAPEVVTSALERFWASLE